MPIRIDKTLLDSQKILKAAEEVAQTCFWDYRISAAEILKIAREGTKREKLWLIRRILENSMEGIYLLWFFDQDELVSLLDQIDVHTLRFRFAKINWAILRHTFGGRSIPSHIPELAGLTRAWTLCSYP